MDYSITKIEKDTTKILPCRDGDIFAWLKFSGNIFNDKVKYDIADIWVVSESDNVLVTNRLEDVPAWLNLYPTKVSGRNVRKMMEKINNGYDPETESDDLNLFENVWQLNCSHYLIWAGTARLDIKPVEGILKTFAFDCGSLVIHQPKDQRDFINGKILQNERKYLNTDGHAVIRKVYDFIVEKGMPRQIASAWKLG